ncbi:MAG: hypothetical protein MMC33_000094 [Icmadophila ericetorum]|nr:hypothetical protein [Icmadophila ericetorum]
MTLRARSSSKTQDAIPVVGTKATQSLEFSLASRTNSTKAKSLLGGPPVDALHYSHTKPPSRPVSKLQKRSTVSRNSTRRGPGHHKNGVPEDKYAGCCAEVSTPVAGCFDTIHSAVAASTSCLHSSGSCSTMRSYYDHSSIPTISQHNPVPPVRDMALRRGYPPMTIPLPHKVIPMAETRPVTNDPWYSDMNPSTKKRRPTRLDFSTLFQKSRSSKGPQRSPRRLADSPTNPLEESDPVQHTPSPRKKWLRWATTPTKETPRSADEFSQDSSWKRDPRRVVSQPYSKDLGPKLQARPDNAELDEYMRFMASVEQSDSSTKGPPIPVESKLPISPASSSSSSIRTLTSKVSPQIEHPNQSTRKISRKTRRGFFDESHQDDSPTSSENQFSESDLHIQSVLALSSSESESDEDDDLPVQSTKIDSGETKKVGRDSWKVPPSVVNTTPQQSHDLLKHIDTRSFSLPTSATKVFERSRATKGEPSKPEPQPNKLQKDIQVGKTASGIATEGGSVPTANHVSVPPKGEEEKQDSRLDRVMAVTREEEKLLEAMREKRASILGQKIPVDLPVRPKTAGTEKQSSFFEADMSSFPAPPKSGPPKVLYHPRNTFSTEDLSLSSHLAKDDLSFSAVTRSFTTISRASSEYSTNASDGPPSPLSPVTPPRLSSDYNRTIRAPAAGPPASEFTKGHSRKRTVSSDMLFFQGLERQETQGDREKEVLGQWALQACN